MVWSFTNLAIQVICGAIGGNAAAAAAKEHNFSFLGHTVAGAVGGAVSGLFLQTIVVTMVIGDGGVSTASPVEQVVLQGFAGAVIGGIATLIIGVIKHTIEAHHTRAS